MSARNVWKSMRARCYTKSSHMYARYGGRGITVCDRWLNSFEAFSADMGEHPPGTSIDRIDNNGNYEPGNCHWVTRDVQNRNKRSNRHLTWKGVTQCVVDWAKETGLPRQTIEKRLDSGWSVERTLTTPKRAWSKRG